MKTKKKLRILGAEDDDFQKMALEMVIGQTGLGSDIFCNGKKAVMAFIKNPK